MKISHKIFIYIGGVATAIALLAYLFMVYNMSYTLSDLREELKMGTSPVIINKIADRKVNSAVVSTGIISLCGLVFFFIVLLLLSKRITAPLNAVVTFSKKLARGDFAQKIPFHDTRDEIGTLIKSLNYMRDRMQSYISRLERSHLREKTARKEAEKANHLKSDFLANMSLELRNPLNSIMGFSNLILREIQKGSYDRDLERKVDTIHKSAEILNNLISNLLELSKLDAEEIKLNISEFNTSEFMREVVNFNRYDAEEKSISLECHFSSEVPKVLKTDKDVIFHVLGAIMSSIIKNMPIGGKVSLGCKNSEGNTIFWIRDSLKAETTEPIAETYNKFLVSQAEIVPAIAGRLLLNLTIARANAGLLGADLQAEKTPEGNSLFELIFNTEDIIPASLEKTISTIHTATNIPRLGEEEIERVDSGRIKRSHVIEEFEKQREAPSEEMEKAVSAEPRSILLAEDNEANRMLVQLLFRNTNYSLECVPDGIACLEVLERRKFDILLLDLQMPNLDGYGVISKLRSEKNYDRMPIVVLTAYLEQNDKQKLIKAGANDCLLKPLDIDLLAYTVRRLTE